MKKKQHNSLYWHDQKNKWEFYFKKKYHPGACRVLFCGQHGRFKMRKEPNGQICYVYYPICCGCESRRWRLNNPKKNAYKELKHSAKRRNIPFTITFGQFLTLIENTDYIDRKGNKSHSLIIDRIQQRVGYEFGNLRIISKGHNSGKGNIERAIPDPINDNEPF